MHSIEVERITHVGAPSPDSFVVGKVLTVEKHPDADKLKLVTVDYGATEPKTVVTGAPNIAPGQSGMDVVGFRVVLAEEEQPELVGLKPKVIKKSE